MSRILVIDDDRELCELLTDYLKPEGLDVEPAFDAGRGIERALSGEHSLVVLDVMLPGASGFDVLRRIKDKSAIPVLMLTARGDEVDRIVGLEMGADDYLPKPFNPRELVARIRAIQRRTAQPAAAAPEKQPAARIVLDDVELDSSTRTVAKCGKLLDFTAIEFNFLEELMKMAGRVVTRMDLSRKVLGRAVSSYDRSIDVHISSIRRKLGPAPDGAERIKTVRSVGYIYALPQRKDNADQ
ncbi:MAG: response regulator transcription factor [Nitrospiraceae bacterium]|nr:response regulator transcription factor [Nitrospiraceae bacterium]